jgi:rod shape-determining protein MreD
MVLNSVQISQTSSDQVEVYRFSLPAAVLIPLLALFLQAFLPWRFPSFGIFDLPLLVTIFLALARRNPVTGLLTGAVIGVVQDSLTHQPLGVFGIAKTVVGYGASSLGVRLDVENSGARLLVVFAFSLFHDLVYYMVSRHMVGQAVSWAWGHELLSAAANALLAVVLFLVLDRFKQRA